MQARRTACDPHRLRLLIEDSLTPAAANDLEQHLQDCEGCREALDRLTGEGSWPGAVRRYLGATQIVDVSVPSDGEALGLLAPSDWPDSLGRLGSYEVKGLIGRGGMGVVFKAFDPALSRNVAVKVLAAPLATCGTARRRFLREARAAAAVVHEHVVAVYAVVESASPPFLVMEYIPGRSLQDRLDAGGPLSVPEVLRIGMQTAAGLAAAHAQGLVHRDVKPANILLEGGLERVRLTDFGLARAAADAGLTQSGVITGTPYYMSPEQARGDATGHLSDLFSLGSTLYAACTGHPPFRAKNAVAVLRRVCDDAPRPMREDNPEVPAWLDAIVAKLLSKDPSARFRSASEISDLLSRCLAHVQQPQEVPLPADAAPPGFGPRPGRRMSWAIATLGIAAVVATVAVTTWSRPVRQGRSGGIPGSSPSSPRGTPAPGEDWGGNGVGREIDDISRRATLLETEMRREHQGYGPAAIIPAARILGERVQSLEREVAAEEPRAWKGRVSGPGGGPVVRARLVARGVKLQGAIEIRTDDAGEFTLAVERADFRFGVVVTAPGLAPAHFVIDPDQDAGPLDWKLGVGATVTGRVIHDGKPAAGIAVGLIQTRRDLMSYVGTPEARTDAEGRFRITRVVADEELWAFGRAAGLEFRGVLTPRLFRSGSHGEEVALGDLEVRLGRHLEGRVVLPEARPTPAGATVSIGSEDIGVTVTAAVDATGRFSVDDLPEGLISVRILGLPPVYHLSPKNKCRNPGNPGALHGQLDRDVADLTILFEPGREGAAMPEAGAIERFLAAKGGTIAGAPADDGVR